MQLTKSLFRSFNTVGHSSRTCSPTWMVTPHFSLCAVYLFLELSMKSVKLGTSYLGFAVRSDDLDAEFSRGCTMAAEEKDRLYTFGADISANLSSSSFADESSNRDLVGMREIDLNSLMPSLLDLVSPSTSTCISLVP